MKKFFILIIALVLVTGGCAAEKTLTGDDGDIVKAVEEAAEKLNVKDDGFLYSSEYEDNLSKLRDIVLNKKYAYSGEYPKVEDMEAYAVYYSSEDFETEFGIFRMKSEEAAEKMEIFINRRVVIYKENIKLYPSADSTVVDNLQIKKEGKWVIFTMTKDNKTAMDTIDNHIYK